MTDLGRHGTTAGYGRHQKRSERPCDACARAKREYDQRRNGAPVQQRANRLAARAQGRAETALRQAHAAEYDALYRKYLTELKTEGES